jgi:predicted transglutaminase-like cysteine proteinase
MPFMLRRSIAVSALVWLCSPVQALERYASLPPPTATIAPGSPARPIIAWNEFCQTHPGECRVNTSEPETIALTAQAWRKIVDVNLHVNRTVKPLTDMEHWGVADRWNFPDDGFGDCEDYQLLKRKLLVEAGFPRRALRMTVVLDELNEGHAVLMVRTDRGDYILDNKRDDVLSWDGTGYVYVKRESQFETSWVSLNHIGGPTVTAARR